MLAKHLAHQLRQPTGFIGKLVARVMESTNKAAYHDVLKSMDLQFDSHVFEIGYGPGDGLALVRKRWPDCRLSGIDISSDMFESATRRLRNGSPNGSIDLSCGDFNAREFPIETYACVICVNVVYFWGDLEDPFKKIFSMLKSQGRLVIFMRDEEYLAKKKLLQSGVFNRHSPEKVTKVLRDAGFESVQCVRGSGLIIQATK